jgi:hypothetical protein
MTQPFLWFHKSFLRFRQLFLWLSSRVAITQAFFYFMSHFLDFVNHFLWFCHATLQWLGHFFYFVQSLVGFTQSFCIYLFGEDEMVTCARSTKKLHCAVELAWAQTIARSKDVLQGFVRHACPLALCYSDHWHMLLVVGRVAGANNYTLGCLIKNCVLQQHAVGKHAARPRQGVKIILQWKSGASWSRLGVHDWFSVHRVRGTEGTRSGLSGSVGLLAVGSRWWIAALM